MLSHQPSSLCIHALVGRNSFVKQVFVRLGSSLALAFGLALLGGVNLKGAAQEIDLLNPLAPILGEGAKDSQAGKDYNVVFVSLTNTRADHLGAYGYARNTSTNIDRFAARSLVFKNFFTHASWTLPVAISLFTSQYPFTHKMMNREDEQTLPGAVPTFIEVLKEHGYQTAAFVGDRDYSQKYGHTSRFHLVYDSVNHADLEDWHRYGVMQNTMPPAREWLRQNKDRKFFLLVQGYDTHCPFAVPKENARFDPNYRGKIDFTKCYWTFEPSRPIKRRTDSGLYQDVFLLKTKPTAGDNFEVMFYPDDVKHMIALYDGEIFNADQYVGGLLDDITALGLDQKTIVVFYADHGDMFGKHGRFMRGGPLRGTFYDDVLRVPMIIYHPGMAPRSVETLGQMIDLGPTLLEMIGLKPPRTFRGRSLVSAVTNGVPVNEYVFAGSAFTPASNNPLFSYPSVIVSARSKEWKLIVERVSPPTGVQDSVELYDLRRDSEELTNVATNHPAMLKTMKSALQAWLRSIDSEKLLPGL